MGERVEHTVSRGAITRTVIVGLGGVGMILFGMADRQDYYEERLQEADVHTYPYSTTLRDLANNPRGETITLGEIAQTIKGKRKEMADALIKPDSNLLGLTVPVNRIMRDEIIFYSGLSMLVIWPLSEVLLVLRQIRRRRNSGHGTKISRTTASPRT